MADDGSGTPGKRMLVMLYAFGIVVIGMQNFKKSYTQVFTALREKGEMIAQPFQELRKLRSEARGQLGTTTTASAKGSSEIKKEESPAVKIVEKPNPKMDRITSEDRGALSKLVNELESK